VGVDVILLYNRIQLGASNLPQPETKACSSLAVTSWSTAARARFPEQNILSMMPIRQNEKSPLHGRAAMTFSARITVRTEASDDRQL
jgi:hypothetical protein